MNGTKATAVRGRVFLERGSRFWDEAWERLKAHAGDDLEAYNPRSGERWQYMGSWKVPYPTERDPAVWIHQFRHRDHPTTGRRWYVNARASRAFAEAADRGEVK